MNKRLTDENLTQIKERTEKATEGKWRHTLTTPEYDTYFIGSSNVDGTFTPIGNINGEVDATFIAHAREDIPKLLAEIEYLRGRQAELLEYNRMYLADIKRMSAEVERLRAGNGLIDLIEERLIAKGYSHADDRYDLFLREVYEILYEEETK